MPTETARIMSHNHITYVWTCLSHVWQTYLHICLQITVLYWAVAHRKALSNQQFAKILFFSDCGHICSLLRGRFPVNLGWAYVNHSIYCRSNSQKIISCIKSRLKVWLFHSLGFTAGSVTCFFYSHRRVSIGFCPQR